MKRLFFVASLALAIFAIAGSQTPIRIAISEWPPFEYSEGGAIKGSDVEIVRAAFAHMKVPVEIEVYPWDRCVKMAKDKEIDGIMTLSKNAERETWLVYPSEPVNISENVLFVRKDSKLAFNSLADLKGLTIGVSSGYSYGAEFDNSTLFKKYVAVDEKTNFRMLKEGRFDAFICDKIVGVYMLKQLGLMGEITYLPKVISEFQMYAAFSKKAGADQLAAKFSEAMKAIKKSGEYQRILDRYIK
jgi:polar amino acid transport system substrate-binding protein